MSTGGDHWTQDSDQPHGNQHLWIIDQQSGTYLPTAPSWISAKSKGKTQYLGERLSCHHFWATPLQLWMHLKAKEKASVQTEKDKTEKEFCVMLIMC